MRLKVAQAQQVETQDLDFSQATHTVEQQTDRQTDRLTDRHVQSNIPPLFSKGGYKKQDKHGRWSSHMAQIQSN